MRRAILFVFHFLFFVLPLFFFSKTSELFEFNKIIVLYAGTICIVGFWLLQSIREKKFLFRRTSLDLPLIFFLITQGLSTLFSIEPRTSFLGYYSRFNGGLLSTVSYVLLYWAFVTFVSKNDVKKFTQTLLGSTLLASIWGALEHFGHSPSCLLITGNFDADCWIQNVQLRVFATFGQPNWMAAWIVAVTPLTWSTMLSLKKKADSPKKILHITIFGLFLSALLFTKSRSGIIAFGVGVVLFWALAGKNFMSLAKTYSREIGGIFATLLVIGFIFGTPWSPSVQDIFSRQRTTAPAQEKTTGPALESGGTESGTIRKIVWEGAINVWRQYPILGSGVETFALSYYKGRPLAHNNTSEWNFLYNKAHNEYLNYLATTGLLGLLSYLGIIGASFVLFLKGMNKKEVTVIAFGSGFVGILITNFFGFSVVPVSLLFFLFPAFAAVLMDGPENGVTKKIKDMDGTQILLSLPVIAVMGVSLILLKEYWHADFLYASSEVSKAKYEYSEAIKSLNAAIKKEPMEPLYHAELGELYADLASAAGTEKEPDLDTINTFRGAAVEELRTVQSLAPYNTRLLKSVANSYSTLADIDNDYLSQVLMLTQTIENLAPTDPSVIYQRALTFAKLANDKQAIIEAEHAVSMKPDYKIARRLLSYLYTQANEKEKAIEQVQYILTKISPDDVDVQKELQSLQK